MTHRIVDVSFKQWKEEIARELENNVKKRDRVIVFPELGIYCFWHSDRYLCKPFDGDWQLEYSNAGDVARMVVVQGVTSYVITRVAPPS